jgi:hypothetical protein
MTMRVGLVAVAYLPRAGCVLAAAKPRTGSEEPTVSIAAMPSAVSRLAAATDPQLEGAQARRRLAQRRRHDAIDHRRIVGGRVGTGGRGVAPDQSLFN